MMRTAPTAGLSAEIGAPLEGQLEAVKDGNAHHVQHLLTRSSRACTSASDVTHTSANAGTQAHCAQI